MHSACPTIPDTRVERRKAADLPYASFLRDYVAANRPVVVEGAASACPAGVPFRHGDTAFVPSRWWHTARVLSPSVSVCTNQLDRTNWNGFVREVCPPGKGLYAVKREAKWGSLKGLGGVLDLLERLGRQDRPLAGPLTAPIGRLAPWSPTEAASPEGWPIGKWRVDGG